MLPNGEVMHRADVELFGVIAEGIEIEAEARRFERSIWATLEGKVFLGSEAWLGSQWCTGMSEDRMARRRSGAADAAAKIESRSAEVKEARRRHAEWAVHRLGQGVSGG